jgi:segregation and condensation protein A
MLLPLDEEGQDDEEGDPRAELVRKLLEYQSFKEAAKELGFMEGERSKIFTRQLTDFYLSEGEAAASNEPFHASLFDLMAAFRRVLKEMKPFEAFHEVFEEVISIEERMEQMKILIQTKKELKFTELFGPKFTRNELIVTFLALLEIIRLKLIRTIQKDSFSDIIIAWKEEGLSDVAAS